jgi:hypothetical protein
MANSPNSQPKKGAPEKFTAAQVARVERMRQPYPKRARSIDSDAPGVQSGEGGADPTLALQVTPQAVTDGS